MRDLILNYLEVIQGVYPESESNIFELFSLVEDKEHFQAFVEADLF